MAITEPPIAPISLDNAPAGSEAAPNDVAISEQDAARFATIFDGITNPEEKNAIIGHYANLDLEGKGAFIANPNESIGQSELLSNQSKQEVANAYGKLAEQMAAQLVESNTEIANAVKKNHSSTAAPEVPIALSGLSADALNEAREAGGVLEASGVTTPEQRKRKRSELDTHQEGRQNKRKRTSIEDEPEASAAPNQPAQPSSVFGSPAGAVVGGVAGVLGELLKLPFEMLDGILPDDWLLFRAMLSGMQKITVDPLMMVAAATGVAGEQTGPAISPGHTQAGDSSREERERADAASPDGDDEGYGFELRNKNDAGYLSPGDTPKRQQKDASRNIN